MKRLIAICIIVCLSVLPLAAQQPTAKGWPVILADYQKGMISVNEKAQLALTLLVHPEDLPERYQIDVPMRDATTMILDIMTDKDRIDPSIIGQYYLALSRVNKQKFFDTPEGHFRIQYDTSGANAVYQANVDVDPADGVPDFVNRTGEYFERAWTFQTDTLGYDTPPYDGSNGGGNNLYDVYMHHYSGAYGVTWPENYSTQRPNRNYDMTSYIYVDPTYNGFGYQDRTLPMKVTSAHEFFHAVQFAYNANAGGWFMENCAVWMEETMWDEINDCYFYMPYFFNYVHYTMTTYNGSYEYGAFVWPTFLSEFHDNDIIRTIWEWSINGNAFSAIVAVLDEYGAGIDAEYPVYATWNFLTGSRDDGNHYEEGSSYNQVHLMRTHTTYPVDNNSSSQPPSSYGCNYVMFARAGNSGALTIQFDGSDGGSWVVPIVKSISVSQHEFDEIELDGNGVGEITIPNFEDYSAVTMIPCLLNGSNINYHYSASLDTALSIDDQRADLPNDFVVDGSFPNPFNGNAVLSFTAPASFAGKGRLMVYDELGRQVDAQPIDIVGGENKVDISYGGKNQFASGLYFYRLEVGDKVYTGKMTYLK